MDMRILLFFDLFLKSPFYRPVQAVLTEPEAYFARINPGFKFTLASPLLISGPVDENSESQWIPIDSPISESMIKSCEKFLGIELPILFKQYMCYKCTINMDLYDFILPDVDPEHPLSWLEWCALRRKNKPYDIYPWLIPFTYGPAKQSDLCFDTRRPNTVHDYPIVNLNYSSMLRTAGFTSIENIEKLQVFDNFEMFFDYLLEWLRFKNENINGLFSDWLIKQGKPSIPELYYKFE